MAAALYVEQLPWSHPDAVAMRSGQRVEVDAAYGRPDSEPGPAPTEQDIAIFVVAYDGDAPVGCGGVRLLGDGMAEVKRMYVTPAARGTGAASAILHTLEQWARASGIHTMRLETGDLLTAAIRFYERSGYRPIPCFGPYVGSGLSRCFERSLVQP